MRLCRFLESEAEQFGIYLNDQQVVPLDRICNSLGVAAPAARSLLDLLPNGVFHDEFIHLLSQVHEPALQRAARPIEELKLLTPLAQPGKFLALAGNYPLHIKEGGGVAQERERTIPYLFLKPANTWTHPGDPIRIPSVSPDQIDWEIELGVIIGKTCREVSEADALDYVAGYTVINDVSDRSYRPNPQREARPRDVFFDWQHGKWHDTFCPWGPCVLPATDCPDPQNLRMILKVNDQTEQDGKTGDMVFPVAAVIEFVSRLMTLSPGDVIATGTPDGVGKAKGKFLKRGDRVTAEIPGIGLLFNPVI